jgi:hypothetical protein
VKRRKSSGGASGEAATMAAVRVQHRVQVRMLAHPFLLCFLYLLSQNE